MSDQPKRNLQFVEPVDTLDLGKTGVKIERRINDRLRAEIERLKAERDALYAACKAAFADLVENGDPFAGSDCDLAAILRKAIAKAEGREEQAK